MHSAKTINVHVAQYQPVAGHLVKWQEYKPVTAALWDQWTQQSQSLQPVVVSTSCPEENGQISTSCVYSCFPHEDNE